LRDRTVPGQRPRPPCRMGTPVRVSPGESSTERDRHRTTIPGPAGHRSPAGPGGPMHDRLERFPLDTPAATPPGLPEPVRHPADGPARACAGRHGGPDDPSGAGRGNGMTYVTRSP
jgi:hypothetical protein